MEATLCGPISSLIRSSEVLAGMSGRSLSPSVEILMLAGGGAHCGEVGAPQKTIHRLVAGEGDGEFGTIHRIESGDTRPTTPVPYVEDPGGSSNEWGTP